MRKIFRFLTLNVFTRWVLYSYLRLLFWTYRLRVTDHTGTAGCAGRALPLNKSRGIYVGWHEEMIAGLFFLYHQGAFGHLVSDASDEGTTASFIAKRFNLKPLEGSGKPSFMRRVLEALEMNGRLYLIGDGRNGPYKELQPQVHYLAERSGVPLIMVRARATSALALWKRWDCFKIPLPFSTITVKIEAME